MNEKISVLLKFLLFFVVSLEGYGLPDVNLGYTNILDGGPIRPYPGVYWQQYSMYYHTHTLRDFKGDLLAGVCSPSFNSWTTVTALIYQAKNKLFLEATPGVYCVIPITLYSAIEPNALEITDAGGGIGNIEMGMYLQWSAIMHKERPLFIHRLACDVAIPSGINKLPKHQINPGDAFFSLNTSWAATLYATEKLAFSWRLNYLWNAKNRKIDFKAGDALFLSYSIEYPVLPEWYVACAGYYLQQLSYNKALGKLVPNSKERIFGLGPGTAYFFSEDLVFFTYLYGEFGVLNRAQGISFVLRLVKHF